MNQLFRISSNVFNSISLEDVEYTYKQMREIGIDKPPYKNFAIEVSSKFMDKYIKNMSGNESAMERAVELLGEDKVDVTPYNLLFEYKFDDDYKTYSLGVKRIYGDGSVVDMQELAVQSKLLNIYPDHIIDKAKSGFKNFALASAQILIVLLATKNAEKNQIIDKDLVRGRFNKSKAYRKDYPATTTISIGKISETHTSSEHGGGTVRPHLRRGHIRTQKYGPNWELSKKIFIEPVFVNADDGWIAERRAYNVKAA